MNGKEQAITQIQDFIKSDEKCVLLTGTHQYNKHKLIMAILERDYEKLRVLLRTNAIGNATEHDFLGFAGIH